MEPHQHDAGRVSLLTPRRAAALAADQQGIPGGASWYTIRGTSWSPINMTPVGSVY